MNVEQNFYHTSNQQDQLLECEQNLCYTNVKLIFKHTSKLNSNQLEKNNNN